MSPDQNGARRRTEFVTDSENINIIVQYSTGRQDLTIRAEVFPISIESDSKYQTFFPESPLIALGTSGIGTIQSFELKRNESQPLPPLPDSDVEDVLTGSPVEPWPVGEFRARIFFDNDEVGLLGFKITWSECPTSPPQQNSPCRQFKPNGACPYNEGSAAEYKCECLAPIQESKWRCSINGTALP